VLVRCTFDVHRTCLGYDPVRWAWDDRTEHHTSTILVGAGLVETWLDRNVNGMLKIPRPKTLLDPPSLKRAIYKDMLAGN
jgi:hypothetical protein